MYIKNMYIHMCVNIMYIYIYILYVYIYTHTHTCTIQERMQGHFGYSIAVSRAYM